METLNSRPLIKVNIDNYYKETQADFEPLKKDFAIKLMDAYLAWRRKKNKPDYIQVDGKKYIVDHESQKKSAFFRSRGFSFYFIPTGKKSIIRISDHWSSTSEKYKKSHKLNCGMIASCYWQNKKGERFTYGLPGENYSSELMAGKISFSKMIKYY